MARGFVNPSSPVDLRALLREQRDYYRARAGEYDDGYARVGRSDRGPDANASWLADLDGLARAFDAIPISGDVVDSAAGTGFWTERLVGRAHSLRAIDAGLDIEVETFGNRFCLGHGVRI